MMTIQTYLDKDEYGGRGVFAGESVKKGDVVWRYNETATRVISIDEYRALIAIDDEMAKTLKKHSYPWRLNYNGVFLPVLMHDLDNANFTNHSDTPNMGNITDPAHPHYHERSDVSIALRDIAKGEQLTYDYFSFVEGSMDEWDGLENCIQFLIDMGHPRAPRINARTD